jgi:hypothetical protein
MDGDAKHAQAEAALRITSLGHVPLPPTSSTPSTSVGCWRNARSSFLYRRRT